MVWRIKIMKVCLFELCSHSFRFIWYARIRLCVAILSPAMTLKNSGTCPTSWVARVTWSSQALLCEAKLPRDGNLISPILWQATSLNNAPLDEHVRRWNRQKVKFEMRAANRWDAHRYTHRILQEKWRRLLSQKRK